MRQNNMSHASCVAKVLVFLSLGAVIAYSSLHYFIGRTTSCAAPFVRGRTASFTPFVKTKVKIPVAYRKFAEELSDFDASLINAALREFTRTLDKANITYFMIEGTLLGSYRHHDRIPWDYDVDLAANHTDKKTLKRLFRDTREHTLINAHGDTQHWKFSPNNGRLDARRIYRRPFRRPFIDVFWFHENSSHIFFTGWLQTNVRKGDVFPLRRRPFGEFFLPAPCSTVAYLTASGFRVDDCVSRHLDFHNGTVVPSKTVPCRYLANIYPFVRRERHLTGNGKVFVVESLMLNGTVVKIWSYEDDGCKYNATAQSQCRHIDMK